MSAIFKKLQLKDQRPVLVLDAPASFAVELDQLNTKVVRRAAPNKRYGFVLAFAPRQVDVERLAPRLHQQLEEDGLLWIAYPKTSSKKFASDISRDKGWQVLGDLGYEGVRQVAIDEDWSAVRFRQVRYIKTLKRDKSWVMSEAGKKR